MRTAFLFQDSNLQDWRSKRQGILSGLSVIGLHWLPPAPTRDVSSLHFHKGRRDWDQAQKYPASYWRKPDIMSQGNLDVTIIPFRTGPWTYVPTTWQASLHPSEISSRNDAFSNHSKQEANKNKWKEKNTKKCFENWTINSCTKLRAKPTTIKWPTKLVKEQQKQNENHTKQSISRDSAKSTSWIQSTRKFNSHKKHFSILSTLILRLPSGNHSNTVKRSITGHGPPRTLADDPQTFRTRSNHLLTAQHGCPSLTRSPLSLIRIFFEVHRFVLHYIKKFKKRIPSREVNFSRTDMRTKVSDS